MDCRLILVLLFSISAFAQVDWSDSATLPSEGHRKNIYGWNEAELTHKVREGKLHALYYPVTVSGLYIPYSPFRQMFEMPAENPLKKTIFKLLKEFSDFNSTEEIWTWLGLHDFPQTEGKKPVYYVPFRHGVRPEEPMGLTLKDHKGVEVLTFSCRPVRC